MKLYVEKPVAGLDRRVFRFEHDRIESYIEFAYYDDWKINGNRARWYGYCNRIMPDGLEELIIGNAD